MYFLWTIKINCRRFLGRLSTNVIDIIAYTNPFWNQYFSVDQSDLSQRKQRIHKLYIGLRLWPMCLLKNTAQPEKRDIFMKNGNESWDVLGDSRKRYRGPWAEIGKYWPGKEPIRLQDSLLCPLKKKCLKYMTSFSLVKCNSMIISIVMPSYPYVTELNWTTPRTLNMTINHKIP